jgi:hypothetical protein
MPKTKPTKAAVAQDALQAVRDELRAAGDRRAAALAELDQANTEIADLAIRVKGLIPVTEIAELGRYKTRKAVYDLIAWRTGAKPDRH